MAKKFTPAEWTKIHQVTASEGAAYGLPARRTDSVVIGSFNIRKLGRLANKSAGAWKMLETICRRFDLLAIQEVQDDLEGLRELKTRLGNAYGLVASDITGSYPGRGSPERLVFLFRWSAIERTEVASDITFDRSSVVGKLFDKRRAFQTSFADHASDLADWQAENERRARAGKKKRAKPVVHLPDFVTFIRQPLCVSFRISGNSPTPLEFLAVNAHLLYGKYADERRWEFEALVGWLVDRARKANRMYCPNIILLGDCNLEVKTKKQRAAVDADLKSINRERLKGYRAKLNLPFVSPHPDKGYIYTNARRNQTYDQIGIVAHDSRLPLSDANKTAGASADAFNFDMFNFVELFSVALHAKPYAELSKTQKTTLLKKFGHDLSDHMPIWIRLPKP